MGAKTTPPVRPLSYGRQTISDDDIQAVTKALQGDWLTQGPTIRAFEDALASVLGARHAVAVASGTAAIHLACLALELPADAVGITSAVTFVASANGMRYVGSDVHFADVEPNTGLIDTAALETQVESLMAQGRPPKVLMPVSLTGIPANLPDVERIARRCGAFVVEDAAHAMGATYQYQGKTYKAASCAHSDMAISSFHPIKHITTCEGGAITTNDPNLYERLCTLRSHGIHKNIERFQNQLDDAFIGPWFYEQDVLGFNYRITDVQCALGLSQLSRLDGFLKRRRAVALYYDDAFSKPPFSEHIQALAQPPHQRSAYHLYVIQLKRRADESWTDVASRRKSLYSYLREQEIYCQVNYIPVPWQPYYQSLRATSIDDFPGALGYYSSSLSIPMFPTLTDHDLARVIDAIATWISEH